jgi:hypothetical protein
MRHNNAIIAALTAFIAAVFYRPRSFSALLSA